MSYTGRNKIRVSEQNVKVLTSVENSGLIKLWAQRGDRRKCCQTVDRRPRDPFFTVSVQLCVSHNDRDEQRRSTAQSSLPRFAELVSHSFQLIEATVRSYSMIQVALSCYILHEL